MKKVIGIGGVFFKSTDPKAMNEWYKKNLGIPTSEWGASFDWRHDDDPEKKGATAWSTVSETSKQFNPSEKPFMINYLVEDLVTLVEELKKEGVTILDEIDDSDYGKFAHIMDPDGNKIELWEAKAEAL